MLVSQVSKVLSLLFYYFARPKNQNRETDDQMKIGQQRNML